MKRSLLLVPALALSFGFLAGCGGSDEEPLSSEEFVKQADKICADGNAELEEAAGDIDPNNAEDVEGFVQDVLVPNIQGQHDDLEELVPPEDDQDTFDDMLAALQEGLDQLSDDPSLITSDSDIFGDANEEAQELGLTECGSS
ncbi:hypothetical protein [Nocardioides sp. SR21]|uniref:hypothetical protein n=1 Tax=Nocardioides sp. SR21 TaxID=2919501 RepID=UPI001FAA563E|nr:hypothetical protein [Nocardioides sp. SR21]